MKFYSLTFYFLLLQVMICRTSTAQFNQQKFITYTTADGLTDNYVMRIASDKKGFTWVATRNGISRFDGLNFTNYKSGHGLRSSWVTDVAVDNSGTVWLSTEWGLCYYNEAADRFVYLNTANEVIVLYTGPLHLKGDFLWMAAENGLLKVDTRTKTISFLTHAPIPDPQCIAIDAVENVWVGTRGHGFYVWKNNQLKKVNHPALPADAHLMDFYQDEQTLWCATSEGLLQMEDEQHGHLYTKGPANTTVNALTFATTYSPLGDSIILCGTYNKHIAFFNKRRQVFTEVFSGSNAQVNGLPDAIIHDGTASGDVLWIGSDKGLTLLNNQRQDYATYLLSGNSRLDKALLKKILPVQDKPGKRWLLTNNPGGIALYNNTTHQTEQTWQAPAQRFYEAILPASNGSFYLVHQKGIDRFSSSTGISPVYTEKKERYFSASIDAQQNIWVGTGDGVMQFNTSSKKTNYFSCHYTGTPVENNSFTEGFLAKEIIADNKGHVWIASNKYGLFCFDITTHQFTPYRQPSKAAYETKNRCTSLAFDTKGKLWIGNAAGLTLFDTATKTFRNYSQQQGLQSSYVYAIATDGADNVIGRGNSGVFQFNPTTQLFTNYAVPVAMSASLLEQEVSVLNNEALVGFEGGFSVYWQQQQQKQAAPSAIISACYYRSQRLQSAGFSLNHQQNNLRIDFTAVDYAQPEKLRFRYRLAGGDWINVGAQRSVQLTELSPGDYHFEVAAITADGSKGKPAALSFSILPPFWQTAWFIALLGIVTATTLAIFIRRRLKLINAKQEERQRQQQLKLDQYKQQLELEKISSFFSRSLLDKNTQQEVLDDVAENLIGQLDFENCMIYVWSDAQQMLLQQAGIGRRGLLNEKRDRNNYHLSKGIGIVGATVESGVPQLVNDIDKDERYVTLDGERCGSELCVPLIQDSNVIGAINVEQLQKNYFSARHVQTLTTIATLTAHKLKALSQAQALHQKQLELSQASRKLSETELSLLRSQMNPHFIFNSLNSIQKYIWEAKQEDAAEYLTKFSRLIRFILESSAHKLVPLQKEIASLKLYLELEHRRSNQKFDYQLSVAESLDTALVQIPPLLLQPYIENAIWHGLNAKPSHGELIVSIQAKNDQLICLIDDNGIGRRASQQLRREHHVSMGLNISQQRVQLLQQETGVAAHVTITDKLTNSGDAAGTLITITLPLIESHA